MSVGMDALLDPRPERAGARAATATSWQYMLVAEGAAEIALRPDRVALGPGRAPRDRRGGRRALHRPRRRDHRRRWRRAGHNGLLHEAALAIIGRAEPDCDCGPLWRSRSTTVSGAASSATNALRTTTPGRARPRRTGRRCPLADPAAAAHARRVRRPGAACSRRARRCGGDRGGPAPLDDPARPAGQRQDDARADLSPSLRTRPSRRRAPSQAGRAEVRAVIERARQRLQSGGQPTIFFLDEIHRFNKAQQDALLPAVEDGLITLIGATTENPYFEVNSALLSRARVYELEALAAGDVRCCSSARSRAASAAPAERIDAGGAGVPGRAHPAATRGRRSTRSSWPARPPAAGRAGDARARRGRAAAARAALRPPGRPPLRHDLGLDQGDPRLGPRRLAVLPGGDARGRRGPALHRPPDGDPRLRGHRQRRPAGAGGGDRGRGGGRARGPARVPVRARPGGDLPVAGAEVRRRQAGGRRRARLRARARRRSPPPAYLRSSTRSDGRLRLPASPRPGHFSPQELLPDGAIGARFYEPDDAEAALRERLAEIRRARGRGPDDAEVPL